MADVDVLQDRITKRIGKMIEEGGKDEILRFFEEMEGDAGEVPDEMFEKGILQSIGYKEFYDFYKSVKNGEDRQEVALKEGMDLLDLHTIQYAKYQRKFIQKKILDRLPEDYYLSIHLNEKKHYEERALNASLEFIQRRLQDEIDISIESPTDFGSWQKFRCETCDLELNGEDQYRVHMKSKKHKKKLAGIKRRAVNEERRLESEKPQPPL